MLFPRLRAALLTLCLPFAAGVALAQVPAPAAPRFDILEFVVEGDTLLGAAAIERAVYPFLGPRRSADDADAARRALEKAYQDAGFLSVSVVLPPQRVDGGSGEVRLQVVQAPVEKLRVTGARYFLPSLVSEAVPSVAPGNVPNFNEMQAELAQFARASADRQITPVLTAGVGPGTMNVELKVQDNLPLQGSAEINSKQSQNTAAGRFEGALAYDNLFQRGHSIGLNWFYSPRRPDEANIQSLAYQAPLGGAGDRLSIVYTHSDSNTATPLGGATVSRGNTWRLRWRDELPGREGVSHGLSWGITLRHLRDRNEDVAGATIESPDLRYPTFQLGYDLTLAGAVAGRSTRLQAEVTASVPGLSRRDVDCFGTVRDQFDCKRAAGRRPAAAIEAECSLLPEAERPECRRRLGRGVTPPGFEVYTLTITHREPLGRWSLSGRLQAQLSDEPLVSAEQAVYGGQDSVRGYYEGEQAGDLGAALRLELGTPPWPLPQRASLRALAFYDHAWLARLYALPGEQARAQLASAGLGFRLETGFGLQVSLDWARLLYDSNRYDGSTASLQPVSGSSAARQQRWDFSLRQSF